VDVNEPVSVYATKDPAEAEMLKNLLAGEGIKSELEGEGQASLAGILDVKVLVRAWDEERARQVLASHAHHHHGQPKKNRGD
jgi:hypothetical protein